ncbi:AraC family transcriptional regulator [Paenibacillus filicis]|uniref:AraC family transcriptional regulator n=1 Tax=Paenibacillus filicis TaxID=669464 RepID=A0ABU9DSF0_9BACL
MSDLATHHLYQIVEATMDYIEEHLKSNISLDALSSTLGLSKYHLHRLIKHTTGMPIMHYIRARKLSASVDYLLHTNWNIIDIASEFGFLHEQTYIRSFKRQFGVTPSQLRKNFGQITLTEKFDLQRLGKVADGLIFEPQFVVKPITYLAGRKGDVNLETNYLTHCANAAGNAFFYKEHPFIPNKVNPHLYIGLTVLNGNSPIAHYIPSTEVYDPEGLDASWDITVLPAQKYIVFTFIGDFHPRYLTAVQLREIWSYMDHWLPQSLYMRCAPYFFEYIDTRLATEQYCEVDLYLPICSNQEGSLAR